jgi:hypothetical protein
MLEKCGKFMADWRDSNGVRHRAAFPTKAEAVAHQKRMRSTARPSRSQTQAEIVVSSHRSSLLLRDRFHQPEQTKSFWNVKRILHRRLPCYRLPMRGRTLTP